MFEFINSLNWVVAAVLITVASSAFYIALLLIVRGKFPLEKIERHHEVAGFSFSVIGVLYSVLLGFIVVSAQNRYDSVSQTISEEASALAGVYRDSVVFPIEAKNGIRESIVAYINYVIDEEWSLLARKRISSQTQATASAIWDHFYSMTPTSDKENTWYSEAIGKMNEFTSARIKRQLNFSQHISPMMWVLLLSGAGITICFMFFFAMKNIYVHMIIISVLSSYINFMLYLVYCLDHVFDGPIALEPQALENLLQVFKIWDHSGN